MKSLKPENFPIDASVPFKADAAFYLERFSALSNEGEVTEITSNLTSDLTGSDIETDQAKEWSKSVEPCYTAKRKSWFPTRIDFLDPKQSSCVASLTTSIVSRGVKKLSFPETSAQHSEHNIEIRPVGVRRKAESFVKDSVLYFWSSDGSKSRKLYKALGHKSIQIGAYSAKLDRSKAGVLLLMTSELDVLVGIVTCYDYLSQVDAFSG